MRTSKTVKHLRLVVKDMITSLAFFVALVGAAFIPWTRRR